MTLLRELPRVGTESEMSEPSTALRILSLLAERGPMRESELAARIPLVADHVRAFAIALWYDGFVRPANELPRWTITDAGLERLAREKSDA